MKTKRFFITHILQNVVRYLFNVKDIEGIFLILKNIKIKQIFFLGNLL